MTLKTPSLLELWLQMLMMIELFFWSRCWGFKQNIEPTTTPSVSRKRSSLNLNPSRPPQPTPLNPLSLLSSPSAPCWEQGKARLAYPPNITHCLVISNKNRGGICHSRHSRRECKIFASGVNFSRNNAVCYINESKKLHFILISSLKLLTYY